MYNPNQSKHCALVWITSQVTSSTASGRFLHVHYMQKMSLESPEGSPECLFHRLNSDLLTYLWDPSGKWWSLSILARQILYQILEGHCGTQFAEQNKDYLLIVQTAALHCVNNFITVNTALHCVWQVHSLWNVLLNTLHVDAIKQTNSYHCYISLPSYIVSLILKLAA